MEINVWVISCAIFLSALIDGVRGQPAVNRLINGIGGFAAVKKPTVRSEIFHKHVHDHLDVELADDIDVDNARQCSVFCLNADCDGFAFYPSAASTPSKCFPFTYTDAVAAANLTDFSTCSFYVSNKKATTVPFESTPVTSTTTMSTTTDAACINLTGGGCMCPNGATNADCTQYMTDCNEYFRYDGTPEGLLHIKPSAWTGAPFLVRCYRGETLIQMRDDVRSCQSFSFNRSWSEYRDGFGDIPNGCFWLGNDKISALSRSSSYYMTIETTRGGEMIWITAYANFIMASAADKYRLHFSGVMCNGVAQCDGFYGKSPDTTVYNHQFYTYDQDINGCAAADGGGWWYNTGCSFGNLNGKWPTWPLDGAMYILKPSVVYLHRII